MRRSIVALISCALSGYTTVQFVRKDLSPEKKAVLRYSPQSDPEAIQRYRDEVSRRGSEFCGGPFGITKEYEALVEYPGGSGFGTGLGMGPYGRGFGTGVFLGGSTLVQRMYHFVEIKCGLAQPSTTSAPDGNQE